jgi:hypothetical protein
MKPSSYSDRIDTYQTSIDNLEPDLAKYPGTTEMFLELKSILLDLRPAHATVEAQRGNLRVAVKARRDLAVRGGAVHRRLSALVAAHAGFANPILVTYGMNPETNSRRGKRKTEEQKKKDEEQKKQEKEAMRLAVLQEMAGQATA